MSTVATKLSSLSTKFQVGAGVFALAGAAALMPGAVANAAPAAPMPMASLGSALDECDVNDAGCDFTEVASARASASATAEPAFCTTLVCFGAGLTDADNILVAEWNMIPLLPSPVLQDLFYGFWADVIPDGFTACLFGNTAKINSYSTVTVGFTKNCSK